MQHEQQPRRVARRVHGQRRDELGEAVDEEPRAEVERAERRQVLVGPLEPARGRTSSLHCAVPPPPAASARRRTSVRPKAARANAHDGTRSRRGAIATAPAKHAIVSGQQRIGLRAPVPDERDVRAAIVAAASARRRAAQGDGAGDPQPRRARSHCHGIVTCRLAMLPHHPTDPHRARPSPPPAAARPPSCRPRPGRTARRRWSGAPPASSSARAPAPARRGPRRWSTAAASSPCSRRARRVLEVYDARDARAARLARRPAPAPTHVVAGEGGLAYVVDTAGDGLLVFETRGRLRIRRRYPLPGRALRARRRTCATGACGSR